MGTEAVVSAARDVISALLSFICEYVAYINNIIVKQYTMQVFNVTFSLTRFNKSYLFLFS